MDRFAFYLNLHEDGRPEPPPELPAPARARATEAARALARGLVPEGSRAIGPFDPVGPLDGLRGRAFLPTERARALLAAHGAVPDPAPGDAVLRAVLQRGFAYVDELGGGCVVQDALELGRAIDALLPRAGSVRVKAAYGHAGRGHRVLHAAPTEAALAALAALGPALVVEPEVVIRRELSIHGHLDRHGALTRGAPCGVTTARGVFVSVQRLPADDPAAPALRRELESVAEALFGAGYFGPFGVDAYAYDGPSGTRLRARSEINARYTMAFSVGMGDARPDLGPP